jgi:hypothetical protein
MSGRMHIVLAFILTLCVAVCPRPAAGSADVPGASPSGMLAPDKARPNQAGADRAEADQNKPDPAMTGADAMTDIHDIRALRAPGPDLGPLVYGLAVLAAAALAAVLVYLWKRRRRRLKGGVAPALPPDAVALSALDELADIDGIDGRLFYFRLSAVLRRYLHERYGIPAPEMTTEELLPEMDRLGVDRDRATSLKQLFSDAEPVKYAGRFAVVDRMKKDLDLARNFIRETVPADDGAAETGHGAAG